MDLRQRRKAEHLAAVRTLGDGDEGPGFDDIHFLPNCAPELDWDEVDLTTSLAGTTLPSPIVINAMTGGTEEALAINRSLALAARKFGLAMAVGSEKAALTDPRVERTFTVAREMNPDGVLIANVGMGTDVQTARAAVNLIDADLLQVHWNVGQELFMTEGDRRFRGAMEQFHRIAGEVGVPVIAKEVGQGISGPEALRFWQAGARAVDVGGRGGTNFMAVEAWRRGHPLPPEWQTWGIPTAAAVAEAMAAVGSRLDIVASGGIRNGHDLAKAMAMGARAVGIAGPILRILAGPGGEEALDAFLTELQETARTILLLTGSRTWKELAHRPLVVVGRLREWMQARGLDDTLHAMGTRPG